MWLLDSYLRFICSVFIAELSPVYCCLLLCYVSRLIPNCLWKQPTQPVSHKWLGFTAVRPLTPPSTTWRLWWTGRSWRTKPFQFLQESNLLPTWLRSCWSSRTTLAFGQICEMSNFGYHAKYMIFDSILKLTQTKFELKIVPKKMCNLWLICFHDKKRKSWSNQVLVGLVCYVQRPIGYLHRIWVKDKRAWDKITPMKLLPRIWAKCTGSWGQNYPIPRVKLPQWIWPFS